MEQTEEQVSKSLEILKEKNSCAVRLGEYAVKGGPGRGKGTKNKFTLIKEQIAELWEEEHGKESLRKHFKKNKDFMRVMREVIVPLIPKEPLIKNEYHETNIDVRYEWQTTQNNNDTVQPAGIPEPDTQRPVEVSGS